ncbi:uncharacterized protein LOC129212992 isoform X6 [Grus americana]|uniref:uncharacterized protein LOC129212799 isoform X4 n=1 Tax=Grus americana TaxID=9117 RepID=UPI0024078228|nr:uncharacterized protein LOC129212799 isoform X4 [Grus americana]XP_054698241.1 uncharacterized protein LOC129212992 isoform X6 [Grus americana]
MAFEKGHFTWSCSLSRARCVHSSAIPKCSHKVMGIFLHWSSVSGAHPDSLCHPELSCLFPRGVIATTWNNSCPQRAKYKAETGKRSQQSSEDLKEILKELDKAARELDRETVEEEALQEGGSQAAPVSDEKKGAIQSTGVPALSNPGEAHHTGIYEFFRTNTGVDGKRNANAMDPDDFQKYCIEGAAAILGSMLLGMLLCCGIYVWRKRRQRLAAAS